jgi:hypothetical protein
MTKNMSGTCMLSHNKRPQARNDYECGIIMRIEVEVEMRLAASFPSHLNLCLVF